MFRPGFGTRKDPLGQDSIFNVCGDFCVAALTKDATRSSILGCFFCKLTFLGRVWDPKGPFSPGFEFQCVCVAFACERLPMVFQLVPPQPPPPGTPKCYLEQATKVHNYKTEHVLCFCGHFLEANHFFKLRIEPSTFLNKAVCVY